VLTPSAHGRGIATEAAGAAIAWGDGHFESGRMSCIIEKGHSASVHVAEKCGFAQTGETDYHGARLLILHREIPG